MTAATPQQLADLVQEQQAAEAAALEDEVAQQADDGAGAKLAALVAVVLTAWITAFGTLTAAGAGAKLVGLLADVRARVDRASTGLGPRSQRVLERALGSESRAARRRAAQALLAQRGLSARVRRQAAATAAGRT